MITGRGGAMRGTGAGRIRPPRRHPTAAKEGTTATTTDGFEYNWQKLKSAIQDIHLKNTGALTFEQLYRHGYKIVILKLPHRLYDNVKALEAEWFTKNVSPKIFEYITTNLINVTVGTVVGLTAIERRAMGEKFLKVIKESWDEHVTAMNMIADILMYLDRGINQSSNRPTIFAATIGLYRDQILRNGPCAAEDGSMVCTVGAILSATIVDHINMEREGDAIDKSLLRSCTSMLESLHRTDEELEDEKLYLIDFEPEFLQKSRDFYKAECEKLLQEADASAWLRCAQRRLEEEDARCATTISPMTKDRIAKVVEDELIEKHLRDFLNLEGSGFRSMINNDRLEDLSILYRLVIRVDSKRDVLRDALAERVSALGHDIQQKLLNTDFSAQPAAEPAQEGEDKSAGRDKTKAKAPNAAAQQTAAALRWLADVLGLKDRFDGLLKTCFADDLILQTALAKSYADVINLFDRSAEYLSLFIDDNLKRGARDRTEAEIDANLEKATELLRFIRDRDKFELYYQKHLAKRLLQQKDPALEKEDAMLSRMRLEMGNQFTHKFDGMFKDMKISKTETDKFSAYVKESSKPGENRTELSINVLGGNNWPMEIMGRQADGQGRADIIYPKAIQGTQESFFKFYCRHHEGRLLQWIGAAGTADIRCVFPPVPGKGSALAKERTYDLSVSTYGMIILLMFNDLPEDQWLTFSDVQGRSNIPQNDLINTLTSLSVIKATKVLRREPVSNRAVRPTDKFSFNREFHSKLVKIKVASVNISNKVENEEERKQTDDKTIEQRKYVIDCAIVRIMKSRKEMFHSDLLSEVIRILTGARQFQPNVKLIKERIEDLIGREYIERASIQGGEQQAYRYVA